MIFQQIKSSKWKLVQQVHGAPFSLTRPSFMNPVTCKLWALLVIAYFMLKSLNMASYFFFGFSNVKWRVFQRISNNMNRGYGIPHWKLLWKKKIGAPFSFILIQHICNVLFVFYILYSSSFFYLWLKYIFLIHLIYIKL